MKITVRERCSEAYHAEKDGKEFQVGLRFEDGTATYPKKCTVIIDGEEETVDIGEGDDRIKKAVKAGAEKLGYKIAESVDELGTDATGRYYHKGNNHGSRCTLIYKLNGRKQEPLRVGGIDLVHVVFVIADALEKRHSKARIDASKIGDLIFNYENAHSSDTFGSKYTTKALNEILPKAVPGLEVIDVLTGKKSESMEGWDDWEEIEGLEDALYNIEDLAYELRSCVRGANTNCKTWAELSKYVVRLADALQSAGEDLKYKQDAED